MNTTTTVHKAVGREFAAISPVADANEVLVVCPNCKTVETLLFSGGHFYVNRKFIETDTGVYHDCGSKQPCRIFQSKKSAF